MVSPLPTYPPALPSPVAGSNVTLAHQSRGTPSTPHQACSIRASRVAGKSVCRVRVERLDGPVLRPPVDVGARPEAVRDAAAAERDAAVGGPLGVAVGVRAVAEQLGCRPSRSTSQTSSRSGSVTTIAEFIGSHVRRWPRMLAV